VAGCCEHGNEPSVSIKCLEILEWVSDWWLPKKDLVYALSVDIMIIRNIVTNDIYGDLQMKGTVACLVKVVRTGARQIRKLGHRSVPPAEPSALRWPADRSCGSTTPFAFN
jgi:hypothetical protein